MPGFDLHLYYKGKPKRYSIHISGPWCIIFEFKNGEVLRVGLGQYH